MGKIKVAHEAPIQILEKVAEVTDYSYALVHLFEEYPEYFEFFKKKVQEGKHVILDNSIFELGRSFDESRYSHWLALLEPTEYIIPDVLENGYATIQKATDWMEKYATFFLNSKMIGVVQGKSYSEIVNCYEHLDKLGVDKIAISFDYSYYVNRMGLMGVDITPQTELMAWALGRIHLIERLLKDGIINKDKPHHLLGASMISEFKHYRGDKFSWIETLDTSNPVVCGMNGIEYDYFNCLSGKPSIKLFELIDLEINTKQEELIMRNIEIFKRNL